MTTVEPALGTAPKPALGTAPKPAPGTAPKPALGTAPKPALGTAPKPAAPTPAAPKPAAPTPALAPVPVLPPLGRGALRRAHLAPDPGRTSFKVCVIAMVGGTFVLLVVLQQWLWPAESRPGDQADRILSDFCWCWAVNVLPAAAGAVGMLTIRPRRPVTAVTAQPIPTTVCFRVVTRGSNVRAVVGTVQSITDAMTAAPLFPYRVEVVTDRVIPALARTDVDMIVVPAGYSTPTGAKFKARALHYALERSDLPDDGWILHLDEESHIDMSTIVGVRQAVQEEEQSGRHRIGQGMIVYHRDLGEHPFLTLADSVRTGDDLGRFALQHLIGLPLFGLHGSFILVRNDVEKQVGFDLGADGSITEDAYWALLQMGRGRRTRWLDGVVIEQSTQSILDFLKQRRRWFVGLVKTVRHAPVRLHHKVTLGACMAVWAASWLSILTAVLVALGRVSAPPAAFLLGAGSLSVFVVEYVIGLRMNLAHRGPGGAASRLVLYVMQIVLIPLFSVLEVTGVLYGLVRPESGFHVVKK